MRNLLLTRITYVWLMLIAATALSWWLGMGPLEDVAETRHLATTGMMLIAFIKTHLVLQYFMEVRTAPWILKRICELWGIVACTGVLLFYWLA